MLPQVLDGFPALGDVILGLAGAYTEHAREQLKHARSE